MNANDLVSHSETLVAERRDPKALARLAAELRERTCELAESEEERAELVDQVRELEDLLEARGSELRDVVDLLDRHGIPERRTLAQRLGLLEGRLVPTAVPRSSEPA